MAPSGPRQEARLVVCLYKMLTTSLTGSPDFWFRKISPLVSKTTHALTGAPVAKCVVSMSSCTVTCVFLYLVTVQSARYYSPNNLSLLPADTKHNNTKPALIT